MGQIIANNEQFETAIQEDATGLIGWREVV
jgi:hypothetical protein